ncbi:hypothetical protein, partial [Aliarcobacter butzleri]|uniref:hypothetical protein n=1 Tax=Aliarcobacter butzleri TaxID=28197 RepID=UPI0021B24C12
FHKKAFYNSVLVDTIISKSAYLWDLMKLFYIEIYDLLCAKVELLNDYIKNYSEFIPKLYKISTFYEYSFIFLFIL